MKLTLIGIGTGNPDHITRGAVRAMQSADLVILPRKGESKADLAELRRDILADVAPNTPIAEFDLPVRDDSIPDYSARVNAWHDAIAQVWAQTIAPHGAQNVALLVWGDPALYDSTLRIAARLSPAPQITVIPAVTSITAMTAAHRIALNDIGAPFSVTTGRQLRETGFPAGVDTAVVMLDGETSFTCLPPEGITIYWTAYAGMENEISIFGPLRETAPKIIAARNAARAAHGWIMDVYLLRRA
ncbi:MAG: precorrin-6A synthase (deacetylating) [Cypionkella sp.]|nr:precorrin-6A synthase (deacetylating) [Cypionkella sp.]